MMLPEPENTGATGRNLPPLPKGVAGGYTTPGGKTVTPSYGDPQWTSGSAIDQLLQQIATDSGISSLFGLSGNSAFDDLHPSTVGQAVQQLLSGNAPVTPAQIVKALDGLHQMPQFNQLTGSYGPTQRQRIEKQILDAFAGLHQVGDPSGGRLPGTAKKRPDLTWIEHLGERSRQQAMTAVHHWIESQERAHDPGRHNPIHGGPHPQWWSDPDGTPGATGSGASAGTGTSAAGGSTGPTPTSGGGLSGTTSRVIALGKSVAARAAAPARDAANDVITIVACGAVGGILVGGLGAIQTRGNPALTAVAVGAGYLLGLAVGISYVHAGHHFHLFFPSDDGGGVGPRASPVALGFMPDPETGTGGGPRGTGYMPDPDSGTGTGPRAFAALGAEGASWFPNPEDTGGTGPKG